MTGERAAHDAAFMRRALELAGRGWGQVWPNPMVGAIVVRGDEVVGEGWHERLGGAHAEVNALAAAGERARGATLYVTLEPCAHHGRTPPCTDSIQQAGITRVVYAIGDPNPEAAGGGARLRAAGIEVEAGVEREAARVRNAAFLHVRETGTPFVALKYALSMDARLAAHPGERTAITGETARDEARRLRAGYSAIVVGVRTVLADDPLLTASSARQRPARVVFDTELRTPGDSRLARSLAEAPLVLVCAADAAPDRRAAWEERGVRVLPVPRSDDGLRLDAAVDALGKEGLDTLFVEGGGRLGGSLLRSDRVDWLYLFHGPILLGGEGVPAFPGLPPGTPSAVRGSWQRVGTASFDDDVLVQYRRIRPGENGANGATGPNGVDGLPGATGAGGTERRRSRRRDVHGDHRGDGPGPVGGGSRDRPATGH